MKQGETHEIVQGEDLVFELEFPSSIADATPSIKASLGMQEDGFILSKPDDNTVKIINRSTEFFAIGQHTLQVWLSWSSGDVRDEMPVEIFVVVRQVEDAWDEGFSVIDGGFPATVHEEGIDGGSA